MFAAETLKLDLSPDKREQWMQVSLDSKAWPDALPALRTLCDAGMRMAYLSNFSAPMLDAGVANSGLQGLFEPRLSTHRVGAYRPDPRAHQMAGDAFGMPREAIPFVAFGGWEPRVRRHSDFRRAGSIAEVPRRRNSVRPTTWSAALCATSSITSHARLDRCRVPLKWVRDRRAHRHRPRGRALGSGRSRSTPVGALAVSAIKPTLGSAINAGLSGSCTEYN